MAVSLECIRDGSQRLCVASSLLLLLMAREGRAREACVESNSGLEPARRETEALRISHPHGQPELTFAMDSGLRAAAVFARRLKGIADRDAELQRILDEQCKRSGDPRILVSDVDLYRGPEPDLLYCDSLQEAGATQLAVFNRTSRAWLHRRARP